MEEGMKMNWERRGALRGMLSVLIVGLAAVNSHARTITVDDDGPADFDNIRAATGAAVDGDTVLVRDGLYKGNGNRNIYITTKAITVRSENGPETCVIDCEGLDAAIIVYGTYDVKVLLEGLTVKNSTVSGISCVEGSLTVSNCNLIGNNRVGGGYSAAIFCSRVTALIKDCVISENAQHRDRAGIYIKQSEAAITNCLISGNDATGIDIYISDVEVDDCIITNNVRGILVHEYSNVLVKNCVVNENSGYGIYCFGYSSLAISDCTVKANSSTYLTSCPGITAGWAGELTVVNCTITGNLSRDGLAAAGGIAYHNSPCKVVNSIIFDNWGTQISPWYPGYEGEMRVSFSDVERGWSGTGNIDIDPCFLAMGHWNPNGTPGDATDDFWIDGNYHLRADSPCTNAGDPNFVAEPNQTDIDGEKRVMLERVDMGADEFNPFLAEFVVVRKDRVDRSVFEYECEVVSDNVSAFAVENVSLEIAQWSPNMTIIDPSVSFSDVEIGPGESAKSVDTCTFTVDRFEPIDPAKIIWHVTAELVDTGAKIENTVSTPLPPETADFDGLKEIAQQWLWQGTAGGIDEDTIQDGTVNLADFAKFADQWKKK